MANPANLAPWKAGQSGNPGGKPVGARNRLRSAFVHALADEFEAHGRQAITRCREEDPVAFLRVIALLLPKELELEAGAIQIILQHSDSAL